MSEETTLSEGMAPADDAVVEPKKTEDTQDPIAKEPAAPDADDADKTEDDSGEPAAENDEQGEEKKPKKNRAPAKVRIAELTAQKYAAEAKAETALAELRRLKKQMSEPTNPDASFEEAEKDRMRSALREERFEQMRGDYEEQQQQARRTRQQVFEAKLDGAAERMPGVLDKFYALPRVSEVMADFVVESDKTAEVAWYLGNNPAEASRIAEMQPHKAGVELARIEAKLSQAQPKRTSTAPKPVATLQGGPGPTPKDPNSMSMADYVKWRKAGGGG